MTETFKIFVEHMYRELIYTLPFDYRWSCYYKVDSLSFLTGNEDFEFLKVSLPISEFAIARKFAAEQMCQIPNF